MHVECQVQRSIASLDMFTVQYSTTVVGAQAMALTRDLRVFMYNYTPNLWSPRPSQLCMSYVHSLCSLQRQKRKVSLLGEKSRYICNDGTLRDVVEDRTSSPGTLLSSAPSASSRPPTSSSLGALQSKGTESPNRREVSNSTASSPA